MTKKLQSFFYFDSSVLLRYAIRHIHAMPDLNPYTRGACSSVITGVECLRVLDRWRLTREISDRRLAEARSRYLKLFASLRLVELDQAILAQASQTFPIAMKTLDALHLATALCIKQRIATAEVVMMTHDQKLALASEALGLQAIGVNAERA